MLTDKWHVKGHRGFILREFRDPGPYENGAIHTRENLAV
jgi:hypothetical protein